MQALKHAIGLISSFSVATYIVYTVILNPKSMGRKSSKHTTLMPEDAGSNGYSYEVIKESSEVFKYKLYQNKSQLKYEHVMSLIQNDIEFRTQFLKIFKESPFDAYFFETPAVNVKNYANKDFEFVLVDSTRLANVQPDVIAFQEHFRKCDSRNVAFKNLGKDAVLVAPCPVGKTNMDYFTHLAKFMRNVDPDHVSEFWEMVAIEMNNRVVKQDMKSTWLSTSGLGIYWLHMRLDSRPKYYTYYPYKASVSDAIEDVKDETKHEVDATEDVIIATKDVIDATIEVNAETENAVDTTVDVNDETEDVVDTTENVNDEIKDVVDATKAVNNETEDVVEGIINATEVVVDVTGNKGNV